MTRLKSTGLQIPHDIAVIVYDNQELIAANVRPALSTMVLPHYAMGVWAVRYLLEEQPWPLMDRSRPGWNARLSSVSRCECCIHRRSPR